MSTPLLSNDCVNIICYDQVNEVLKETSSSNEILVKPNRSVFHSGYQISSAILLTTNAVQAVVNRLLNNNSIKSSDENSGAALFANMALSHFSNKILKGNWRDVDSTTRQCFVLTGNVASAMTFDTAAYLLIPGGSQQSILGQTTAVALANSFNFYCAMLAMRILGQKSYAKGEGLHEQPTHMDLRKGIICIIVVAKGIGISTLNRIVVRDSVSSIVLNTASAELATRLYKSGRAAENTTSGKIRTIVLYTLLSITADAMMGIFLPSIDGVYRNWTDPLRYFGPATFSSILSGTRLLIKTKSNEEQGAKESAPLEVMPLVSKKIKPKYKQGNSLVAVVAMPVIAAAAYYANASYFNASKTFSLGIKLIQHNVNSIAVKDLYKKVKNTSQHLLVSSLPLIAAASVEFLARRFGILSAPTNAWDSPITAISLGITANFIGTTVSNKLLKSNEVDDE